MKKTVEGTSALETLSQKKSTDARADGGQNGYYRNQDEVDAAFAKRFAQERAKWEQEQLAKQQELEQGSDDANVDDVNTDGEETGDADEQTQAWIDDVAAQAEVIAEFDPDFDLVEELDGNPLFGVMLAEGEPLEKVYGYFYPEYTEQRIIDDVEKHVYDSIRSRSAMPAHMSYSAGHAGMDARRLSDAQIREIDKRVRGGEKIRF